MKKLIILSFSLLVLSACQDFLDPPPTAEPPTAPAGLTVAAGDGEVRLSWQRSDGASGYNVYRSESPNVVTSAANRRNPTLLADTTFTDREVANGATYYYVVTAVDNRARESQKSNEEQVTLGLPAPRELIAEPGNGEVRLRWTASASAIGYNVYRSESPNVEVRAANRLNPTLRTTPTFTDNTVMNGNTYYYVVTAVGSAGESEPSEEVGASPTADVPAAPSQLRAEAGDGEVTLSWQASDGAIGYNVYRSETPGVEVSEVNRLNADPLETLTFADEEVSNGETYYYVVTAVAEDGRESAASDEESATPEADLIPRPQVTAVRPEDGATDVLLNAAIATDLHLPNGGVDINTLTPASVRLVRESDGAQVDALIGTSGGFDTITLDPQANLEPNTRYRFEITDDVKDQEGMPFMPFTSTFTTGEDDGSTDPGTIAFEQVALPTADGTHYTSLVIGPDGQLYASTITGEIARFSILDDGTLGSKQVIESLPAVEGGPRLLIGLAFDPVATAADLVLWASHTAFAPGSGPDWTGKITRLSGPNLETVQDYVIGLPRSIEDHVTNSIAFGPDGAMYVPQGSNSGMGAPDRVWGWRPERLLTAALLRIEVDKIISPPLDVKTEEGGSYDPFAADAPVTIFATGVRNAYDLVWHSNGQLYVPGNGSAANNSVPRTPDPLPDACDRRIDGEPYSGPIIDDSAINARYVHKEGEPEVGGYQITETQNDWLFRIEPGGYYGHPNPIRCEWVMDGGNLLESGPTRVSQYRSGTPADPNYRGVAFVFGKNQSANGIIEYESDVFNGALKGKLLVVRFATGNDILALTPGGPDLDILEPPLVDIPGFTGFVDPLTLVENPQNGHLYVAEFNRRASGLALLDVESFDRFSMEQLRAQDSQPRLTLLRPIAP